MAENILAVLPRDLPGIVMVEPALRALKSNLAKAKIYVVVNKYWSPLAEHLPFADEMVVCNSFSPSFIYRLWELKIQRIIFFDATILGAALSWTAQVKKRVGFRRLGITPFLNRRVKKMPKQYQYQRVRHMVELVRYFGCHVDDRIPRWEQRGSSEGPRFIVSQGLREHLPKKVCHAWEEAGFERFEHRLPPRELYQKLSQAQMVVGPPDSPVTLAQALGIPHLRITSKKIRYDAFPGAEGQMLPVSTPPDEALKNYEFSRASL